MAISSPMSRSELLNLAEESSTTDIATAARAFGLGSNLGYDLAARGLFPCRVLKLGRKLRVPTADLLEALGVTPRGQIPP
jgi:hypothetical protein